jgi:hypothetical protein
MHIVPAWPPVACNMNKTDGNLPATDGNLPTDGNLFLMQKGQLNLDKRVRYLRLR